MATDPLADYISSQRQIGTTEENIKQALLHNGYQQYQIDGYFTTQPTKQRPSLIMPVVTLTLGLLVGGISGFVAHSFLTKPTRSPALTLPSPSPTSAVVDCKIFGDLGYIQGFYQASPSSQLLKQPEISVPESCQSIHDQQILRGQQAFALHSSSNDDAERRADLYHIWLAVDNYAKATNGNLPPGVTTQPKYIGTGLDMVSLQPIAPFFVKETGNIDGKIYDPQDGSPEDTKYQIHLDQNGRVILQAKSAFKPESPIMIGQENNNL